MSPRTPRAHLEPILKDPVLKDARDTDIVILVMGATGSGKSSSINKLLDHLSFKGKRLEVGDELKSCTQFLESIVIEGQTNDRSRIKGHRVIIVDTPGFDDTFLSDVEILRRIAGWLEASYRKKMVIGGVIYLHDISNDRFSGTARKNLDIFHKLCGQEAFHKVTFVTSKWGRAFGRDFGKRETELKDTFWKSMVDSGAGVQRLDDGKEGASAWEAVLSMLDKLDSEPSAAKKTKLDGLEIQKEIVRLHKDACDTGAGVELRKQLQKVLDEQQQIKALESDVAAGDHEAKARIQEREDKIQQIVQQIDGMKVSLPRRISGWVKSVLGV